jgi:hypothetical protein
MEVDDAAPAPAPEADAVPALISIPGLNFPLLRSDAPRPSIKPVGVGAATTDAGGSLSDGGGAPVTAAAAPAADDSTLQQQVAPADAAADSDAGGERAHGNTSEQGGSSGHHASDDAAMAQVDGDAPPSHDGDEESEDASLMYEAAAEAMLAEHGGLGGSERDDSQVPVSAGVSGGAAAATDNAASSTTAAKSDGAAHDTAQAAGADRRRESHAQTSDGSPYAVVIVGVSPAAEESDVSKLVEPFGATDVRDALSPVDALSSRVFAVARRLESVLGARSVCVFCVRACVRADVSVRVCSALVCVYECVRAVCRVVVLPFAAQPAPSHVQLPRAVAHSPATPLARVRRFVCCCKSRATSRVATASLLSRSSRGHRATRAWTLSRTRSSWFVAAPPRPRCASQPWLVVCARACVHVALRHGRHD